MATSFSVELNQIRKLYQQNKTAEAISLCERILSLEANNYEVKLLKGLSLVKGRNYEDAEKLLKSLTRGNKKDDRPVMGLGFLYEETSQVKKANQAFWQAMRINPKNTDARFHHVLTFERMNKLPEAEQSFDEGYKQFGDVPGLLYMGALIKRRAKKHEEALILLNKIPNTIEAEYVSNKHFELMQNHDRLGNYDDAFNALTIAQDKRKAFLTKQGYSNQSKTYHIVLDAYLSYLNNAPKPNTAKLDYEGDDLCFFVGFPRSGTTLAQQMMQAHPDIETLEEKPAISDVCELYLSKHKFDFSNLASLSAEEIKGFQDVYFNAIKPHLKRQDYKMLVDKMPLSMAHLPIILTLFPKAKILVALRHPCDCLLSCMMQNFEPNGAMMNLTNLEDGSILYDKVFTIFDKTKVHYDFALHIYKYEDIIVETEKELKAICDFLGLTWDDDMMDYREKVATKQEHIATPSFRQVIEPLHTKAKYRWKNYEGHFKDHLPKLEPYLKEFNYPE